MLFYCRRYNFNSFFYRGINICERINNTDLSRLTPPVSTKILLHSLFFSTNYARNVLQYINILYCNFFIPLDNNHFVSQRAVTILYTQYHPGFYYKHVYSK